jgi:hypothetical protein
LFRLVVVVNVKRIWKGEICTISEEEGNLDQLHLPLISILNISIAKALRDKLFTTGSVNTEVFSTGASLLSIVRLYF